ncbi:hypothetical protein D9758_007958 [Tetrapyrgos nigripes]|uniref:Uncharacterized protein n=1 Tax=Tetrapyrgos nigripes TaxID=182062 RepID=A0A8H5D3H1_9AGAR|nr:hypothetical protein D9758_007958 [Tetrapyrgos nigripes]
MILRPPRSTREGKNNHKHNIATDSTLNASQTQGQSAKLHTSPNDISRNHHVDHEIGINPATQGLLPTLGQYQAIEADYLETICKTNSSSSSIGAVPSDAAFDRMNFEAVNPQHEHQDAEDEVMDGTSQTERIRMEIEMTLGTTSTMLSSEAFERIWRHLDNPAVPGSQKQDSVFKEFSLCPVPADLRLSSSSNVDTDTVSDSALHSEPELVLMHTNRMVASCSKILEETLATVNKYYTFVPPELVDAFVKICPGYGDGDVEEEKDVDGYGSGNETGNVDATDLMGNVEVEEGYEKSKEISSQSMSRGGSYTSSRGLDLSVYASKLRPSPPPDDVLSIGDDDNNKDEDNDEVYIHNLEAPVPHVQQSSVPPTLALFSRFSSRSSVAMASSGATINMDMAMTKGQSVPNSYEYGYGNNSSHSIQSQQTQTQTPNPSLRSLPMSREVSLFQGPVGADEWMSGISGKGEGKGLVGGSLSMRRGDSVAEFVEKEREREKEQEKEREKDREEDKSTQVGENDHKITAGDGAVENNIITNASKTAKLQVLSAFLGTGKRKPSRSRVPSHVSPLKSGNWANSVTGHVNVEDGEMS